jgi:hypothetical protein
MDNNIYHMIKNIKRVSGFLGTNWTVKKRNFINLKFNTNFIWKK